MLYMCLKRCQYKWWMGTNNMKYLPSSYFISPWFKNHIFSLQFFYLPNFWTLSRITGGCPNWKKFISSVQPSSIWKCQSIILDMSHKSSLGGFIWQKVGFPCSWSIVLFLLTKYFYKLNNIILNCTFNWANKFLNRQKLSFF